MDGHRRPLPATGDGLNTSGPGAAGPFRVGVIAGDGIGPEVVEVTRPLVERAAAAHGARIQWTDFPWGCDHRKATGRMMPDDALDRLAGLDAIFLGAVGRPDVPDHLSVWELILPIRQRFDQYVNLRPMRLLEGVSTPLAERTPEELDMVCVRENSEGEYAGLGSRSGRGSDDERAEQTGLFTRRAIERVARFAFELADSRPRKLLASATKSNALQHSMVLWDEVVEAVAADYPDVTWRPYHVDALAARMVTQPDSLDVIVASNLFGDILTDLGAALTGSLGLAPGANLNPTGEHPSMFEPIHGSAPDIAGRGVANPLATVQAGALMLDHLGLPAAGRRLTAAVEAVLREGRVRTPDLGGTASTREMAAAVGDRLPAPGTAPAS
jgi:tartrate dehydrogenase/decarboxylase/D-malate dehydrogenase